MTSARILLAWVHLLALAIGLGGVWARARATRDSLRHPEDAGAVRRVLTGDAWWGIAAVLWLVTGLWRLLGSMEKGRSYYFVNHAFQLKMLLFLAVAALEVWPMMTLLRLRSAKAPLNPRNAGRIEVISYVQCALIVAMVLAAVNMARGYSMAKVAQSVVVARDDDVVVPVEPTGVETVSDDDVALLTREIAMPLDRVDPATLKSSFDERRGGGTRPHEALDLMSARGTPVKSAAKGRVLRLFNSKAGGLMVYAADSSERFILLYAHLDRYEPGLTNGAALSKGQVIGYVGSTGNASVAAPHLHFGISRSADVKQWSKGKPIDPLPILKAAVGRQDVSPFALGRLRAPQFVGSRGLPGARSCFGAHCPAPNAERRMRA